MAHNRAIPSHLRSGSLVHNSSSNSSHQSPAFIARINEKKIELANLKELRALSAALADQMAELEQKLSTLSDGTEAVATVLANWQNVLRAIGMASSALPKPKESETREASGEKNVPLPQTLVRIPTQSAGALLQANNETTAD